MTTVSQTDIAPPATPLPEQLATGTIDPGEVFEHVKRFIQEGGEPALEGTYASLRSLVWNLVASREYGPHLQRWADAILRVRQWLRVSRLPGVDRFTVLSDLLQQSARFPVY